jgi:hypothetical protein
MLSISTRAKTSFLEMGPQPFSWGKLQRYLLIWGKRVSFIGRIKEVNLFINGCEQIKSNP